MIRPLKDVGTCMHVCVSLLLVYDLQRTDEDATTDAGNDASKTDAVTLYK